MPLESKFARGPWLKHGLARAEKALIRVLLSPRTRLQRYSLAGLVVGVSIIFTWGLESTVPGSVFYSANLISSIVAAALGGFGPGVIAGLTEALLVDYFLMEPKHQVLDSWSSIFGITLYVSLSAVTCLTVSILKSAVAGQQEATEKAESAARARENVLAVVSHDLRNPLASISMSASLIERLAEQSSNEKISKHAEKIRRASTRIDRQVNDLLDAVKIEKGTFNLQVSELPVFRVIEEAVHSVSWALDEKNLQVEVLVEEPLPLLVYDFDRILQCLTNLIGNAIKFSPPGSKIKFNTSVENQNVVFRITDQGAGVPENERKNLFKRFWQSRKTAHQGTGLGLFIVKSIAEAHGGRAGLEEQSGPGSTFYFSIPLKIDAALNVG